MSRLKMSSLIDDLFIEITDIVKKKYWDEYFMEIMDVQKDSQLEELCSRIANDFIKDSPKYSTNIDTVSNVMYDVIMKELEETGYIEDINLDQFYD